MKPIRKLAALAVSASALLGLRSEATLPMDTVDWRLEKLCRLLLLHRRSLKKTQQHSLYLMLTIA